MNQCEIYFTNKCLENSSKFLPTIRMSNLSPPGRSGTVQPYFVHFVEYKNIIIKKTHYFTITK